MERPDLVTARQQAYEEYVKRVQLGEFDANSAAIQCCLHHIVNIYGHLLEEKKKTK